MKQYKLEIFSRDFSFKDFSPIEQPNMYFDYLSPDKNEIDVPKINAKKGDYINITDIQNNVIAQGIVNDIERDKHITRISYLPLISIFNTDVSFDRTQSGNLESFLSGIINANFVTVSDTLQRLPIEIITTSTTDGKLNLKDNVHNLFEIILKCFNYGVVVNMQLDIPAKKINVTIGKISNYVNLESKLSIEHNILIGDSYGALNKITLINKNNESQTVTYYLHTDGSINTNDNDRVTPVFFSTQYIEGDTFLDDAEAAAKESLQPQAFNNLIELTFPNDSKIIQPMPIGTIANIDGIESIFTGYEKGDKITKYIFGIVRIDLTKILKKVIK